MKHLTSSKTTHGVPPKKDRILFFDILKILCIALIVYGHSQLPYLTWLKSIFFMDGYMPFNIYPLGLTGLSVYGIIFVSGAVIEYNYPSITQVSGYVQFIFKRFIRLYPAFWMSLILGIILFPIVLQNNLLGTLFEFTGFYIILGKGSGIVNNMGWFIGTIFSLYLLFPYLSTIVRKYQLSVILGLCIISWGLRSAVLTYDLIPLDSFLRWFPLFNAFEFCLGIYIVQKSWYPKKENVYPFIRKLADLSFYVFLFHMIIIFGFLRYVEQLRLLVLFDKGIAMNNLDIGYTIYYIQMMVTVLVVSWIAMEADIRIQKWILQRESVKKNLTI